MKRFLLVCALALGTAFTSGCGRSVTVPGACVGKVLTSSGYQATIRRPSSFRLPAAGLGAPPKLVVAEISDQAIEETMEIFMPKDQLKLTFDVRGTGMVRSSDVNINAIFDRVASVPMPNQQDVMFIDFDKIYDVYGRQPVRTRCRELMSRYTIEYIMSNQEAVSQELFTEIAKSLENTPISFSTFALAKILPPEVIVKAQEQAKQREIAIRQAEANKIVALTEAEAALEVARKQQEVDLTEAQTQALVDKKLNDVVSPAFAMQRGFKVLEKLGENGNLIVFMPYEAMNNPALMTGVVRQTLEQAEAKKGQ